MQFVEMQKTIDGLDKSVIDRTVKWLMQQRNGDGLFKISDRDARIYSAPAISLYTTWALTEADFTDLQPEIQYAYRQAKSSKNPYELALAANTLFNANQTTKAEDLLKILSALQTKFGDFKASKDNSSAVGSRGRAYQIETTALAISAMLKSKEPNDTAIKNCIHFLKKRRGYNGRFGSSQSTLLALRAIVEYIKYYDLKDVKGTVDIFANGKKVKMIEYQEGEEEPIKITGLEKYLSKGKNEVQIVFNQSIYTIPYQIGIRLHTALPKSSEKCELDFTARLASHTVKVGETVRLTATIKNKKDKYQSSPMVILGLPAGLTAQPWQLKELQEQGKFDYYELRGNELILYYEYIKSSASKSFHLDLKAELARTFDAPASRAYLYYYDEHKTWTTLDKIKILAN